GEYPQMQQDLDNGLLDLIITPQKGNQQNLEYKAFSKERLVLIAGSQTDTRDFKKLTDTNKTKEIEHFLKQQLWYSTAADMEHLKNFWLAHFGTHPDFSPNFIVPNISSIIRCLSGATGFSVVPDFLCSDALSAKKIQVVWEGAIPLENTLYFGTRKKTMYSKEIETLEKLLKEKWKV
ncbi:LysR family transcriptional regulator, partial [Myroides odoratimimus]